MPDPENHSRHFEPFPTAALSEDAAELIALSACATCEATRLHWERMFMLQEGRSITPIDNPYMDVLVDMLRERAVLPDHPVEQEIGAVLRDARSELDERLAQKIVHLFWDSSPPATRDGALLAARTAIALWYEPTEEGDADASAE